MPSLSNQLATLTEKLKNAVGWLDRVATNFSKAEKTIVRHGERIGAMEKRFERFDKMKMAMIITIVGAAASAIFGAVIAFMNMSSGGGSTP